MISTSDAGASNERKRKGGAVSFELLQINDEDYAQVSEAEQDRHIDQLIEADEQVVDQRARGIDGLPDMLIGDSGS